MGQTYVDVAAAQAEMGIMTMNTSGSGQEGGYWLFWNENGYTGINWYWNEASNYVATGWKNYVDSNKLTCGVAHASDETGLRDHISGGHAEDLNDVLGPWDVGQKMIFVGTHYDEFENAGCLTEA